MQKLLEKKYAWIAGAVLFFMAAASILNAWWDSAIFDETAHIGAAYTYVTQHQIRLNPEHPPLLKDLAGFPLLFQELNFDINKPFWDGSLPRKWDEGQWLAGKNLLYDSGNNPDQIVFWARIPIVILSLILGWFIFFWTRRLAGTLAGLLALVLYAFDPNILGHNHFVTTDLGIAAAFTFCFYFFLKFIKEPSWKNVFWGGIFLGILELTKFSFIVAFPVLGIMLIIYPLVRINRHQLESDFVFKMKKLGEYLGKGIAAFLVSLVLVWVVYFLNTYKMPPEIISKTIDANFSTVMTDNPKDYYTNRTLHLLNNYTITRPFVVWGEGIGYVFRRVSGGNGAYFMGEVSGQAFRAYFPTVFLLKEPLANLFLMLTALIISLALTIKSTRQSLSHSWRRLWHNFINFLRTEITLVALSLFILVYAYISITGNLNIGLRHLFPIFPFLYILTARRLMLTWKKVGEAWKNILAVIILSLAVFLVWGTVRAYPYYMSYFNEIAGGSKNGYRYVTDSNADWGQDIKRLKSWIENYNRCIGYSLYSPQLCSFYEQYGPIQKIRVDYFGGGDTKYYIGPYYTTWWDSKRPIETGWYAISVNYLMGSLYTQGNTENNSYRWLLKLNKKPTYQVGTSILIYYITPEDLVKLAG